MAQGVAARGAPAEHAARAIGAFPPEGLVLPFLHRAAHAVEVVRREGEILHAGLRHSRHGAPGVARHVADHRGLDGHAALGGKPGGVAHQVEQLLRAAKAGEDVAVEGVQADLAGLDGGHEGRALLRRGGAQVVVHAPEHFDIPYEAGAFGVVGGGSRASRRPVSMLLFCFFTTSACKAV